MRWLFCYLWSKNDDQTDLKVTGKHVNKGGVSRIKSLNLLVIIGPVNFYADWGWISVKRECDFWIFADVYPSIIQVVLKNLISFHSTFLQKGFNRALKINIIYSLKLLRCAKTLTLLLAKFFIDCRIWKLIKSFAKILHFFTIWVENWSQNKW